MSRTRRRGRNRAPPSESPDVTPEEASLRDAASRDRTAGLAYADWLMERDRTAEAAQLLARWGEIKLVYRLRSVLDRGTPRYWADYNSLRSARCGFTTLNLSGLYRKYREAAWEIVLLAVREQELLAYPATRPPRTARWQK